MLFNDNIRNMKIENGRAVMELVLPDWKGASFGYYEVYLWEAGALCIGQGNFARYGSIPLVCTHPVFYCTYPSGEEEECKIKIVEPHLWQGVEKPYLYQLELYQVWEESAKRELVYSRFLAVRNLERLEKKGIYLNGEPFVVQSVYYENIYEIAAKGEEIFWEGLMGKLRILAQMGCNVLVLGSIEELSMADKVMLQKYCDRIGLLVYNDKNDNCVMGKSLFHTSGVPTEIFYRCKSGWSREPFVYICSESFCRRGDGSYELKVYSNCRKVTLMIQDRVFGVKEDKGELLFEDIQIEELPVDITARTEACSMTVRCYEFAG